MIVKQPTILIIDDSPEDRATYRRYLLQDKRYTYTILEEEYGEDGLKLCQLIKPDAILLDFLLPDIDGLEFLNELKMQAGQNPLPVVMLTGQGNEAIAVQAMKGGAQDYLVKNHTTAEGLRLAVHSVVERTHLLRQLERSEKRFRLAVNNFPYTFVIYDAERRIQFINTQGLVVSGYPESEILGHRDEDLFPPEVTNTYLPTLLQAVKTRTPQIVECSMTLPSGEFTIIANYIPVLDERGEIEQILGIAYDITERKQIEAERDALLAREQAANRAKDEFLAMVSHELRNPLSAILSYTQLLRTRKLSAALTERAFHTIEQNAKLQAQLIEDLLDLSRITAGNLHLNCYPLDLVFVVESAIDTLRLTAEAKSIEIETTFPACSRQIMGDANRLQQVIWNLLSNAIKFTPAEGQVSVQLEYTEHFAQLTVSDTGQGIDAEFLPYVFERFRQAERADRHGGLGLGLSIVQHLTELHQGTVEVASPGSGQGATFTIKLPLIDSLVVGATTRSKRVDP